MNDTLTVPSSIIEAHSILENKMLDVLEILEKRYRKPMPIAKIEIDSIGCLFGYATPLKSLIVLNKDLCFNPKYWNKQLNDTLPHEICHLVSGLINDVYYHGRHTAHGRAWKECMRVIGLVPNRCGHLDDEIKETISLRIVKRKYVYECPCGKTFNLTAVLHNKIQRGNNRTCRACHGRIVFKGEKINP